MKRYTLLRVPKSGLFYSRGKFRDGDGVVIPFNGRLVTYTTKKEAKARKKRGPLEEEYVLVEFVELTVPAKKAVQP